MAIYAIGDIQGCYEDLRNLLDTVQFNKQSDTLLFVGDLVNRGPDSLSTLRFIKDLGKAARTVLGNHDLHLLAIYHGIKKNNDAGVKAILEAEECSELINWLRKQPLLYHDQQHQFTMVHAGIFPQWTLTQAQRYARELEQVLQSDNYLDFLNHMYGNEPNKWNENLKNWDRLRFICNSFTRMRYCYADNRLDFEANDAPGTQGSNLTPWFEIANRPTTNNKIVFGHWSTLGYYRDKSDFKLPKNIYATDSGCVWGGQLSALKIENNKTEFITINCPKHA